MEAESDDYVLKNTISKGYNIIRKVGEGGFGEVHLVQDKKDRKQYVVKVIHGRTREENEWAKKEIQFLKDIRHPNIVLYKEDFDFPYGVIVIMEYCSGGDFAKLIKSRSAGKNYFREDDIIEWLIQICEALQYLHSKKILHRDLKPANIFIAEGNIIKLGDFGVSRQLVSSTDLATTMVGTPLYISPEQQKQEPYNHKADVWSAGCSVYEMMAFRPAIDPMIVYITQQWVVREMPTNYSKELCNVVRQMLTVDKETRPSTDDILEYPILKECRRKSSEAAARAEPVADGEASCSDTIYKREEIPENTDEDDSTPHHSDEEELNDVGKDFAILSMSELDTVIGPGAVLYTTQDLATTYIPSNCKESAKDRLRELGYQINDMKQLRSVDTNEPFIYDVNNGDVEANEKRYQEVAKVVNEYVGDLLELELQMSRVTLPVDIQEGEPFTCIYATPDFLMNRDKLLILVGGGNGIRAGVWSRKVAINDSLETGSQMPVIKQAIEEGYSVIIMNQNQNDVEVDGVSIKVRDNFDANHHAQYVWDAIVVKNTRVRHIAFLTHSEGGSIVVRLALEREEYFKRLVFAVAFCNSKHDDLLQHVPKSVSEFFNSHSRNWVASEKLLDEPIYRGKGLFAKREPNKVSAGERRPEWTVASARTSVFKYLREEYHKATYQV